MELVSRLFRGDLKLRACLNNNKDHISLKDNNKGNHVFKIQKALFRLDGLMIDSSEVRTTTYGISTADAVLSFKTKRTIINPAYQRTPDNIVAIRTIGRLDQEIFAQERGDHFSPDLLTHAPPDYEAQIRPNSCWAACLVMWRRAEVASTFTQVAYINSAPNLEVGPGGLQISGLKTVISDDNGLALKRMVFVEVNKKEDIPRMQRILSEIGYIFVAFTRPAGGGGHANVLFGYARRDFVSDTLVFDALDPDPAVRTTTVPFSGYFTRFPALVGWRETGNSQDFFAG